MASEGERIIVVFPRLLLLLLCAIKERRAPPNRGKHLERAWRVVGG